MNLRGVAACSRLPLDAATRLFFPEGDGGQQLRTAPWPAPDSHAAARRICVTCPLQAACLGPALREDGYSTRVLTCEERATMGGVRSKTGLRRAPYLTVRQVLLRVADSRLDTEDVMAVLVGRDRELVRRRRAGQLADDEPVWRGNIGWASALPLVGWTADRVRAFADTLPA